MKKKEKLLHEMSGMEDTYLEEANPHRSPRYSRTKIYKWSTLAACFCLLSVSLSLWLFLPFKEPKNDLSQYEGSEYYEVIQKISDLNYTPLSAENNFQLLMNRFFNFESKDAIADGDMENADEGAPPSVGTDHYVEVTDNQVEGMIEGDLFKRTHDRVFYLRSNVLVIYSIEGENSRELGRYEVGPIFNTPGYYYYQKGEIYLSQDGKTVTIVMPHQINSQGTKVGIVSLDVSNPEAIQKKHEICISGGYLSSRSTDGDLILMTEYSVGRNVDFSDEKTFIPQIKTKDGEASIPMKDIFCPENLTNSRYTVICRLDEDTLSLKGCAALLSYSREIYVSEESIYATREFQEEKNESKGIVIETVMTEISRLSFDNNCFVYRGAVTVSGSVLNQYSMDEYRGMLRIVTTTEQYQTKRHLHDGTVELYDISVNATNANLYIIDLSTMTVRSMVEHFAPDGEQVRSVRFDQAAAYVCTSLQLSDPVFFFDLSDPDRITWKDTGTIEGFSSSLINFGNGFLLGIGRGNGWDTVKIEIYEEGKNGVESVAVYEEPQGDYATDYKSYFIDRKNQILGFAISRYGSDNPCQSQYVLLIFDGYHLHELLTLPTSSLLSSARAFTEDNFLYLFHADGFEVAEIPITK